MKVQWKCAKAVKQRMDCCELLQVSNIVRLDGSDGHKPFGSYEENTAEEASPGHRCGILCDPGSRNEGLRSQIKILGIAQAQQLATIQSWL